MSRIKSKISEFFIHRHDVYCNQKYAGDLPYSFHLKMVDAQALRFQYYITDPIHKTSLIIGIWGHDAIEDARMTFNDIVNLNDILHLQLEESKLTLVDAQAACRRAAHIIYACTELRGHNRKERHGPEYMTTLINDSDAIFVKLCDIIANVKFSLLENSSMFYKYKTEWCEDFRFELAKNYQPGRNYLDTFPDMVAYLDQLFSIKQ